MHKYLYERYKQMEPAEARALQQKLKAHISLEPLEQEVEFASCFGFRGLSAQCKTH